MRGKGKARKLAPAQFVTGRVLRYTCAGKCRNLPRGTLAGSFGDGSGTIRGRFEDDSRTGRGGFEGGVAAEAPSDQAGEPGEGAEPWVGRARAVGRLAGSFGDGSGTLAGSFGNGSRTVRGRRGGGSGVRPGRRVGRGRRAWRWAVAPGGDPGRRAGPRRLIPDTDGGGQAFTNPETTEGRRQPNGVWLNPSGSPASIPPRQSRRGCPDLPLRLFGGSQVGKTPPIPFSGPRRCR